MFQPHAVVRPRAHLQLHRLESISRFDHDRTFQPIVRLCGCHAGLYAVRVLQNPWLVPKSGNPVLPENLLEDAAGLLRPLPPFCGGRSNPSAKSRRGSTCGSRFLLTCVLLIAPHIAFEGGPYPVKIPSGDNLSTPKKGACKEGEKPSHDGCKWSRAPSARVLYGP